jgi:hypothetical protein
MERCFVNFLAALLAIPTQAIQRPFGTELLNDYTDSVGIANRVMRRVCYSVAQKRSEISLSDS